MDLKRLFQIHSNTLHPKAGDVLLSEPTMNDFYFGRSSVLLIDHNEKEGSFGIIMNKPLSIKLNEVVDEFSDFDAPVYLGGPVAEDQIFFMHTLGTLIPDSFEIMDGLYWGGDTETLNTFISTGIATPDKVRFFIGYSGWAVGQLTQELSRNAWSVCKTDAQSLLGTPVESMWTTYVSRLGKEYEIWKRFPKNPEDN